MITTTIIIGIILLVYAFVTDLRGDGLHTPTRAAVALGVGIAIVLGGITVAHAADLSESNWSTGDTWREASFQGLLVIDALQTRQIAENPNKWREQSNYLGAHPTMGAVNRYFLAGSLLHGVVSYLLPEEYRKPFQYVTIGIETGYVIHNRTLGIKAKF